MREYMRERARFGPAPRRFWTPQRERLLGRGPDRIVAIVLGCTPKAVSRRREKLGLPAILDSPVRRRPRLERRIMEGGYISVWVEADDPLAVMARSDGRVMEHRLVMARHLGRPLAEDEFVHHRNGVKDDNSLGNLELWVRNHPDGQRLEDVLLWATKLIDRYGRQEASANAGFFQGQAGS